jgi:hypothetical protein
MNLKIPHGRFGSADYLEPITKDYPEFGTGGAIQAISRRPIKLNRIITYRTEERSIKSSDLKRMMVAGMTRFFHDGMKSWSRKNLHGLVNPLGEHHEIDEPEVQQALSALESDGFIKLYYEDDRYLEVTGVKPLNWEKD